jgi:tripartite-type tricarboxylate transporter receptor subunit TctC
MRKLVEVFGVLICCLMGFTVCSQQGSTSWSVVQTGSSVEADYPTREITLIVGSGAGGGLDNFARAISPPVSEKLNVPVVVVNVQGGAGSVGFAQVMDQEADG